MPDKLPPSHQWSANAKLELDHFKRRSMRITQQVKQQLLVFVIAFAFAQERDTGGVDDAQIVAHERLKLDKAFIEDCNALPNQFLCFFGQDSTPLENFDSFPLTP